MNKMNKLPVTRTNDSAPPDSGRRRFLAGLGLAAIALYAAPMVLQIDDQAQAGSRSDGRRGRNKRRRGGSSRSDGRRRSRRRQNDGRRGRRNDRGGR